MSEAISRLKEAIAGKAATNKKNGRVHTVAVAEVSPLDVVLVCDMVSEPTRKVLDLKAGVAGATEESATVFVQVSDLVHLIEQAEMHE